MKLLKAGALSALLTTVASAQCVEWNTYDVFQKIKENHPSIKIAEGQNRIVRTNIDKVDVLPNPEFEFSTTSGDGNERISSTLTQTILVGGKRSSKVAIAQKEWELNSVELEQLRERKIIESVVSLHRFSFLNESLKHYKEAVGSFKSLLKRWDKRKLSPSEVVEKETLELAYNSFLLKISNFKSEKIELANHLAFYSGKTNCLDPAKVDSRFNYDYSALKAGKSLDVVKAQKILELMRSELSYENSLAYPDFKIGPTIEIEKNGISTEKSIGVSVSFDIPVFNRNSAGKSSALEKIKMASANLGYKKLEDDFDRKLWQQKYKRFKNSLRNIVTDKNLEKKHQKVEKLFQRGVIASSMIIEVHRQLIDFQETKYNFQKGTLEALWNLYRLEGTLLKRNL